MDSPRIFLFFLCNVIVTLLSNLWVYNLRSQSPLEIRTVNVTVYIERESAPQPIRVHPYTGMGILVVPPEGINVTSCSVPCQLVSTNDLQTDAVLFYIPHMNRERPVPERVYPGQVYLALSWECPAYYSLLLDGKFMSTFNYSFGYPSDGENHYSIPFGPYPFFAEGMYAYPRDYNFSDAFLPLEVNKTATISWLGGNCNDRQERYQLVKEIMRQAPGLVYSYGKCLHNTDFNDTKENYHGADVYKMKVIRKHMFDLAFENANCIGWQTEKLFQPMAAHSIPIYYGSSSVDSYLPHPDAIIRVSDFATVSDLLAYIHKVIKDPKLQEKHMAWKKNPAAWPSGFRAVYERALLHSRKSLGCTLCETVERIKREGVERKAYPFPPCLPFRRPK